MKAASAKRTYDPAKSKKKAKKAASPAEDAAPAAAPVAEVASSAPTQAVSAPNPTAVKFDALGRPRGLLATPAVRHLAAQVHLHGVLCVLLVESNRGTFPA